MLTADLTLNGKKQHVLMQPSKNGFMYVLDAKSGKLISADPFTEVNWATGVDLKTGRPIEVPGARYEKEPWNVSPGAPGGHTWHPNAYSPLTGLLYIPTWENYGTMADLPPDRAAAAGSVQHRRRLRRERRSRDAQALRQACRPRLAARVGSGQA